jgi:cellulose synthase/poly-beta-1,6-N-acetylglucosamine synthase-like glycosyltransferase/pSer/pThr/pTyr-binding forkhead associated (FHA) protein
LPVELIIQEQGRAERQVVIDPSQPTKIGRGSASDLIIIDKEASRVHCELRQAGEAWTVADLGSLNGTFVNEQPIQERVLRNGDEIRVGLTRLVFQISSEQARIEAQPVAEQAPVGAKPEAEELIPLAPEPFGLAAPESPVAPRPAGAPQIVRVEHEDTTPAFLARHPRDAANVVFTWRQVGWYTLIVLAMGLLLLWDPLHFLHVAHLFCAFYVIVIVYKLACVLLSTVKRWEIGVTPAEIAALRDEDLPVYTILVPLYHEREVAGKIIHSIEALDYPKDKLDVKLLLEPDDEGTLDVCRRSALPDYCEIIICPDSRPKTKPKACNHGLARARGEYLVIYDGEDRPEPDQLKKAIVAFRKAKPNVICLQAKLNYFNPYQNTLTKWFTIEYSTWFDLFLPGLHALRAPIPLGGTSNHFRASVLQDICGWDPFNVTEDCDLGIRLHKAGYRTQVLDSTTWEEANSQVFNWIRQRSRWVKGYIQTHLVHMRRPLSTLWRLGLWGTFSFLSSVGGLSLMLLLNPIFWAIGAVYIGCWIVDLHNTGWDFWVTYNIPYEERWAWQMWFSEATNPGYDPFWNLVSQVFYIMTLVLVAGNVFFVLMHLVACIKRRMYGLIPWALISPIYWLLISIGAWKGFLQLFVHPFYWEKTQHGLDQAHVARASSSIV